MTGTMIVVGNQASDAGQPALAAGQSFEIHEWRGSGPDYLHIHHSDDEAWHVLEGTLTFRWSEGELQAPAGTTVFVPAGVAHAYYEAHGPTRYLIIMTPKISQLVAALHAAPFEQHAAILRQFDSEMVETPRRDGISPPELENP